MGTPRRIVAYCPLSSREPGPVPTLSMLNIVSREAVVFHGRGGEPRPPDLNSVCTLNVSCGATLPRTVHQVGFLVAWPRPGVRAAGLGGLV